MSLSGAIKNLISESSGDWSELFWSPDMPRRARVISELSSRVQILEEFDHIQLGVIDIKPRASPRRFRLILDNLNPEYLER